MNDYEITLKKLQDYPQFRERKTRGKFLAKLALRSLGLESKWEKQMKLEPVAFTLDELSDFGVKYDSFRRHWTQALKEHKELRGTDYDDKEKLEQEKMLEMGYSPNYQNDVKKLSTL